jgi:hypothetical protein
MAGRSEVQGQPPFARKKPRMGTLGLWRGNGYGLPVHEIQKTSCWV